jgi:plastocyanin
VPLCVACLLGCSAGSSQPGLAPDASGADDAGANEDGGAAQDLPAFVEVGADGVVGEAPNSSGEAGTACAAAFAGCSSFTDATAPGADRTVHFQDFSYDPKCLLVRAGQTVTFAGDFIRHPLTPSCGPELVLDNRDTRTTASFVLENAGFYGYYCLDHGNPQGDVMSGAIEVVP